MIRVIHIPADVSKDLEVKEVNPTDLESYRDMVGGNIQALSIDHPVGNMYVLDDMMGQPFNSRASLLLAVHSEEHRGETAIAGDAFITGPLNKKGVDTKVSDHLVNVLFNATMLLIQLRPEGKKNWMTQLTPYTRWDQAYEGALRAVETWPTKAEVRVIMDGDRW